MPNPTPTPPSTNSSSGASPDNAQFRIVRKRNRVPLSCAACRHRKLKCNRGHPCDNCTKRGDSASCTYAAPSSRKKAGATAGPTGTPDDMQNRIDRLEGLVLSLMTNGSQSAGTAAAQAAIMTVRSSSMGTSGSTTLDAEGDDMIKEQDGEDESDVTDVTQGIGIMKVDNGKAIFASDAHWYAILADIAEVKNYFASHKEQYNEQQRRVQATKEDDSPGASFLFSAPRLNDRSEVMAAFPTKPATDRLVARYFNSYDPAIHIIHGPTFQKQYDRHWQNPNETPLVFIGLLYAIMAISLQSYHRAGDEPPEYRGKALELSLGFRRLTAQTLVLADLKDPVPHMLEALALHLQAEYSQSRDAEAGVFMLVGIIVRLAMRMGYHRDPGPHRNISPFQGEMRRRLWTFIRQIDLLFSFQFGLSSIVRSEDVDTKMPRNLFDDELYEEMPELPLPRPDQEATPMSYMIAKARLTFFFGKITERLSAVQNPPSYDEIMELDAQLREARHQIPPHLQMRSLQESAHDTANLVMQRFSLELQFLKSLCVLHRKLIARGRESPRYAYSRRTCIDASLDMLAHQATLHSESQSGGRFRSVKWYISSLTTHDFLGAAMIVCLDLHLSSEAERTGRKNSTITTESEAWAQDRREEMMNAIKHCIGIYGSLKDKSMEAYKAHATLSVMLGSFMAHQGIQGTQQMYGNSNGKSPYPQMSGPNYGIFPNGAVSLGEDVAPEHSAAMTLGLLSSGGVSPNTAYGINSTGGASMAAGVGMSNAAETRGYPAGMAGLLNEPLPERTGLTPGYSGDASGGAAANVNGGLSPFTQFFGNGMGPGVDGAGTDIDWGAWDSFVVQGASMAPMEPVNMWPNSDFSQMDGQMQQQQGQAQQGVMNSDAVFMGATTPQGGNMM